MSGAGPSEEPSSPALPLAVVLGGGRHPSGELTPLSLQRLDAAIRLHREGRVDRLLVLGGRHSSWSPRAIRFAETAAQLRRRYVVERGVPADAVVAVEGEARDTLFEAFVVRGHLLAHAVDRLGLITSDKHLARAGFIFRRILGPSPSVVAIGVPCGDLLQEKEEAEYLVATSELFAGMPAEIPQPTGWDEWYTGQAALYSRFAAIRATYAPLDRGVNQAYGAVVDEGHTDGGV